MNQAIRNSWIVAITLFALLFGSISYVQFFAVDSLNANPNNNRQVQRATALCRSDRIFQQVFWTVRP